ncbi:MAG: glycosyltransferase family 2 protein [Prevotella sp.]|nr:glycosyltransferase family 2 protein [Candidatus Prevotella equi]
MIQNKSFTVALLISTYNYPTALRVCLNSIKRQTLMPNEIIIADDGSKNDTKEVIEQFRKETSTTVKHVWHEDKGFRLAEIRNRGIIECESDYIIQIDGDILLDKHFIEDHVRFAKKGCFVGGSRTRFSEDATKEILQLQDFTPYFTYKGLEIRENAIRCTWLTPLFFNKKRIIGCNMAYWKKDAMAINGYNEDIIGWGHEDLEFANRMRNNGIVRRHLKFCAIGYHIWHKFQPRIDDAKHLAYARSIYGSGIIRCAKGIDSHL